MSPHPEYQQHEQCFDYSTISTTSSGKDNKAKKNVLPLDFTPNNYTVICGRGKDCFNSVGNRRFRIIVNMHLERYQLSASKAEKSTIVSDVVETIRQAGGGFVKYDPGLSKWYEASDAVAREKTGAYFRDCLHMEYRSSAKAKTARRRANRLHKARTILPKNRDFVLKPLSKGSDDDEATVATVCSFNTLSSYETNLDFPMEINVALVEDSFSGLTEEEAPQIYHIESA